MSSHMNGHKCNFVEATQAKQKMDSHKIDSANMSIVFTFIMGVAVLVMGLFSWGFGIEFPLELIGLIRYALGVVGAVCAVNLCRCGYENKGKTQETGEKK